MVVVVVGFVVVETVMADVIFVVGIGVSVGFVSGETVETGVAFVVGAVEGPTVTRRFRGGGGFFPGSQRWW